MTLSNITWFNIRELKSLNTALVLRKRVKEEILNFTQLPKGIASVKFKQPELYITYRIRCVMLFNDLSEKIRALRKEARLRRKKGLNA